MKDFGGHPDAYYYGLYIQAWAESRNSLSSAEASNSMSAPEITNTLLLMSDTCPHCGKQLTEEELVTRLEKSMSSSNTVCYCSSSFQPKFSIVPLVPDADIVEAEFMNPLRLKMRLNLLSRSSDLLQIVSTDKNMLWNLVFYFSLVQLPTCVIDYNAKIEDLTQAITNFEEKSSTLARFADSFNWRSRAISLDTAEGDTESIFSQAGSEIVTQKLGFLLHRATSKDTSPSKASGKSVFGRLFFDFQRQNMLKQRRLRDLSRLTTDDVGTEPTDISPPLMPEMHNKFV